ncbi:nitrous oxide reductase accessory protein NosL [Rhizobiales bacterium]|uniref:nitrous oxide reductase accessory protein NosL n=1 Tax=Hongsoonwoonella zoysiae TaxID=2821844 RepID=UPI00155F7FFB|nr:nitrous oxide reductase accessory protein NosL [Hongsoonwoonella zoysiae]NRG18199.1 nitrous oxide reductase accessory protein NosL [Hongsoonwoonella zoysiae]
MTRLSPVLRGLALGFSAVLLTACNEVEVAERPDPVTLTVEAAGHYCQMTVLDHDGPKAQIHLAGNPNPVWFTQVRDAVAFTRMPEEPKDWTAVYVNDMGRAESWANPGIDNWVEAREAFFVIGSTKRGGMGAKETIPFRVEEEAFEFAAEFGGAVVKLDDIPTDYVLAPMDETAMPGMSGEGPYDVSEATQ